MLGRGVSALLALVGLAVTAPVGAYFALKRPDIAIETLAAKYETSASRYQDLPSGVHVHYLDAGNQNGPTLVLLHGFSASARAWDAWIEHLGGDHHIIAIDMPGHGLTSTPQDYKASPLAARDMLADFVRARALEPFALGGNSLGGRVAWEYALAFPDHVAALILVDSAGMPDRRLDRFKQSPFFQALQNRSVLTLLSQLDTTAMLRNLLQASFVDDALVTDAMVQRYVELSRAPGHRGVMLAVQREAVLQDYATARTLAGLRMPTLILWGAQDAVIAPAQAEQFRDAIQNSELVMLDNVGHMPHEEAPDETAAAVRAFIHVNAPASSRAASVQPPSRDPLPEQGIVSITSPPDRRTNGR